MIIDRGGLKYERITYNNRWIYPTNSFIDNVISKFISADSTQEYKFVITYFETIATCDATICVYKPDPRIGKLIPLGCASAHSTLQHVLDSAVICIEDDGEGGVLPPQQNGYYVLGYYNPGYYVD